MVVTDSVVLSDPPSGAGASAKSDKEEQSLSVSGSEDVAEPSDPSLA